MTQDGPTREALLGGHLPEVALFYQPVGPVEVPVGTRPFLRRPAREAETA